MSIILLNPPYQKRPSPRDYDSGYLNIELANVQRAIPSQKVRTFTATSTNFTDVPDSTDHIVLYDSTAHAVTVNLPQPAQAKGLDLVFKRINAGANLVTLVGTADGVSGRTLSAQYKLFRLACDGITYYIIDQL